MKYILFPSSILVWTVCTLNIKYQNVTFLEVPILCKHLKQATYIKPYNTKSHLFYVFPQLPCHPLWSLFVLDFVWVHTKEEALKTTLVLKLLTHQEAQQQYQMTYIVNNWLNVLTWTAMANFVLPQNFNPTLCRSVRSNRVEVCACFATQVSSADESKASIVSWEGWIMVHQPTAPPRYTWESAP